MSPALNGSSAIRCFEGSEIRDGITFDFYMGLSHHTFTLSLWWRSYLPIIMIGCPPSLPPYLPDSLKTEMERLEEEAMIGELVELVEKRDALLWALHLEKTL